MGEGSSAGQHQDRPQKQDGSTEGCCRRRAAAPSAPVSWGTVEDNKTVFDDAIRNENVTVWQLLRGRWLRFVKDSQLRLLGESYSPKLEVAFNEKHKDLPIVVQEGAGLAVSLEDGNLETYVLRQTIQFDWAGARKHLFELSELAEEAKRWIPSRDKKHKDAGQQGKDGGGDGDKGDVNDDRQGLLELIFGITTEVHAVISSENRRHPIEEDVGAPPTDHFQAELSALDPRVAGARQRFLKDAQRAAQLMYAIGIAYGAAGLGTLCALLGVFFILEHIPAVYGVGLLAGGVGSYASVLQRMSSSTLKLNFQVDKNMLEFFGAVRPFLGGVFGMVTFCVIKAGLISFLKLPTNQGMQIAFVTVFAFAAGFNERFFQDVLASAGKGLGGEAPVKTPTA